MTVLKINRSRSNARPRTCVALCLHPCEQRKDLPCSFIHTTKLLGKVKISQPERRQRITENEDGCAGRSTTLLEFLYSQQPRSVIMSSNHRKLATTVFFLVMVAASVVSSTADDTSIKYCGDREDYPVTVTGVEIQPNPVKRGKTAKFSIFGTSDTEITTGKLMISVAYFGFNVHDETDNLCEKTSCPISGDFVLSHSQSLPIFTPPGTYTLEMKMLGESGDELTCINFDFSIGLFAPVADS